MLIMKMKNNKNLMKIKKIQFMMKMKIYNMKIIMMKIIINKMKIKMLMIRIYIFKQENKMNIKKSTKI